MIVNKEKIRRIIIPAAVVAVLATAMTNHAVQEIKDASATIEEIKEQQETLQTLEENIAKAKKEGEFLERCIERMLNITTLDKYIYKMPLNETLTEEEQEILSVYPTEKIEEKYAEINNKIAYAYIFEDSCPSHEEMIKENDTANNLLTLFKEAEESNDKQKMKELMDAIRELKEKDDTDYFLSYPIVLASQVLFMEKGYSLNEKELLEILSLNNADDKIIQKAEKCDHEVEVIKVWK